MPDEPGFYSIDSPREETIKIRRSTFTCRMAHVDSLDQAKIFISGISKENKTATHNCWAYIVGENGQIFHSSDAGEPPGTAGKPMLNVLQSHNMTYVAAVVTRVFGGVKLGVKGLAEAYSASVQAAIDSGKLIKQVELMRVVVDVSYDFNQTLLNRLAPFLNRIADTAYSGRIVHQMDIEPKHLPRAEKLLEECQSQGLLTFEIQQAG